MSAPIASAPKKITVLNVLGNGGLFSKHLPNYEAREQQVASAQLIERGIQQRQHVVLELGTGGGKSFAGLVPAVSAALETGQKVVYATFMRSLQGQIAQKDAPSLAEMMSSVAPRPITFAVLKGRGNYVCLKNVEELEQRGEFRSVEAANQFPAFVEWVGQQRIGGELADLESYDGLLATDLKLDSVTSTEECTGQRCKFYEECFAERAKNRAKNADIVIVNTKLLCLDAMIRETSDGIATAVPDYDILIVDEAHNLEGVIRDTAGYEVTPGRMTRLAWMLQKYTINHRIIQEYKPETAEAKQAQAWADEQEEILHRISLYTDFLKKRLEQDQDRREMRLGDERSWIVPVAQQAQLALDEVYAEDAHVIEQAPLTIEDVAASLAKFGSRMEGSTPIWLEGEDRDSWLKLADQTIKLGSELLTILNPDQDGTWVRRAALDGEAGKTRVILEAKPIDVAPIGRSWFFGGVKKQQSILNPKASVQLREPLVVISMSATIATNGNVRMYQQRVGCNDALTMVSGSPFDYQNNALLYLPGSPDDLIPVQKRDAAAYDRYMSALATEMRGLTLDSNGGAFLLFTSRSAMNEIYARIADDFRDAGLLVLRQGDMTLRQMIDAFKADGNAVLFGLKTFGEGVDVQGSALRLVAIDKVPFNPPTDIIWKALGDHIDRNGGNSFRDLSLPSAIIVLKQFVGRLIRSKTDLGIMAILDGRLPKKFYGREIINNMPPARRTSNPDDIRRMFARMQIARAAMSRPVQQAPREQEPAAPASRFRRLADEQQQAGRFRRLSRAR
jgi:ATP-dependent DNA helicase DinG